jgi:hypothetical protein
MEYIMSIYGDLLYITGGYENQPYTQRFLRSCQQFNGLRLNVITLQGLNVLPLGKGGGET